MKTQEEIYDQAYVIYAEVNNLSKEDVKDKYESNIWDDKIRFSIKMIADLLQNDYYIFKKSPIEGKSDVYESAFFEGEKFIIKRNDIE